MASPASAKKQIVESIKESTNILVTVSNNPTVDELSAALGLTIFLNKLGKHATAVASGQMPPAITFLEPNKTFEDSADSLRDFIIALDKDKADHLRYKLEGEVVKIFITPYRAKITSDDLEFSQGDYNVELVLAINVSDESSMDMALSAHGKILHDATVATITAGSVTSDLGTIEWHDSDVSSVSEMASEIIAGLRTAKVTLDEQIATALLTGIVAATDRFSNNLTTSRTMTAAAELMASGANQQLIAAQLDDVDDDDDDGQSRTSPSSVHSLNGSVALEEGASAKLAKVKESPPEEDKSDGIMQIHRPYEGDLDEVARQVAEDTQEEAAQVAQAKLKSSGINLEPERLGRQSGDSLTEQSMPPADLVADLEQATEELSQESDPTLPMVSPSISVGSSANSSYQPLVGGTLNATTAQAEDDKRREIERDQNRTILSHSKPIGHQTRTLEDVPLNASMAPQEANLPVNPLSQPEPSTTRQYTESHQGALLHEALNSASPSQPITAEAVVENVESVDAGTAPIGPTLADIEADVRSQPALNSLPPMPDFGKLPELPPMPFDQKIDDVQPPSGDQQPATPRPAEFNPTQFQIPS